MIIDDLRHFYTLQRTLHKLSHSRQLRPHSWHDCTLSIS